MDYHLVGAGKLAQELLQGWQPAAPDRVLPWAGDPGGAERSVVVHAGSGRELAAAMAFCARTGSVLLELSTGSALERHGAELGFPAVLCPNTNILMLKFMHMLARSGQLFAGYDIRLTESHQAGKTSVPGTAVAMAQSLGLPAQAIVSVRDPAVQAGALGIPAASLARHAYHRIEVADGACHIALETRVVGDAPYAAGVRQLAQAASQHPLANRLYAVTEFIENGWV